MEIQKARSPNYWFGNYSRIAIVDHITAGLMTGCLDWMLNPTSKASAHYLVTRAGEIYNLVDEFNTAWHAGAVKKPSWPLYDGANPNWLTIGIEHEGLPDEPLTEEQYQATLWLHRQIIARWGIPVDEDHVIGHYRIDSVNRPNCPGPLFPWERLFNDLKGDGSMPEGATPIPIPIGGKVFDGYLYRGVSYLLNPSVKDLVAAFNRTLSWEEKREYPVEVK